MKTAGEHLAKISCGDNLTFLLPESDIDIDSIEGTDGRPVFFLTGLLLLTTAPLSESLTLGGLGRLEQALIINNDSTHVKTMYLILIIYIYMSGFW